MPVVNALSPGEFERPVTLDSLSYLSENVPPLISLFKIVVNESGGWGSENGTGLSPSGESEEKAVDGSWEKFSNAPCHLLEYNPVTCKVLSPNTAVS